MVHTKKELTSTQEVQLHLQMDMHTLSVIEGLRLALEASSIGEVIRRAIKAHELYRPIYDQNDVRSEHLSDMEKNDAQVIQLVHVRIPARTKQYLDAAKAEMKKSFSEIVTESLHILGQLLADRERTLREERSLDLNAGGDNVLAYRREMALA